MNLKQIIREEVDDFGWAEDVSPYKVGDTFVSPVGIFYTVKGVNPDTVDVEYRLGMSFDTHSFDRQVFEDRLEDGTFTPMISSINESEWDWTEGIRAARGPIFLRPLTHGQP